MDKQQLAGLFATQTLAQQYKLDSYTQEELVKIYKALNLAQTSILNKWKQSDTEWSKKLALAQVDEARAIMDAIKPQITGSLATRLGSISEECSKTYSAMLSLGGKAPAAEVVVLSAGQMQSYWQKTPVGGHLLEEWVGKTFNGPTTDAIQQEVFAGMFKGKGFSEMSKRLQEGIVISKREADTLVSTYVQTANVQAMDAVYGKNKDVLAGVRWHVAYGPRTCLLCASLAGQLFPVADHPPCPVHPRCRCVLIPETNINALNVAPQVAEDWAKGIGKPLPEAQVVDFQQWLRGQSEAVQKSFYGPTRYDMIKKGLIKWDDLVDRERLRIRTIEELRNKSQLLTAAKAGDPAALAKLAGEAQAKAVKQALADAALTNAVDAAAAAKAARVAKAVAAQKAAAERAAQKAAERAAQKAAERAAQKAAAEKKKKHSEAIKAGIAKKKAALKQIANKKASGERLTAEEAKLYQGLSAKKRAALQQEVQSLVARQQAAAERAAQQAAVARAAQKAALREAQRQAKIAAEEAEKKAKVAKPVKNPATVKNAKKIAEKIKKVLQDMQSGSPHAPMTKNDISVALYDIGITWDYKLKATIVKNLVEKAKAIKKAKAEAAKAVKAAKATAKAAAKKAKDGNVTLDGSKLEWHAPQKGSNKGGFYRHTETGEQYYIKFMDNARIDNEILASKLFQAAGVNVPELTDVIMPDGRRALASKVVPGVRSVTDQLKRNHSAINAAAKRDLAVDAWLANWDVVGLGYDNLVCDAADRVWHIDVGGSLLYRAQGTLKGNQFGGIVGELKTYFDPKLNPQTRNVYKGLTRTELLDGIQRIAAIPEARIRELVNAYGPGDAKQKKQLTATLLARRKYLMDKYSAKPVDSSTVRYGKADAAFAADVNRLGAQGKSLPTDKDFIEDQNVLVFTQETKQGTQTVIKLKLRPGAADDALRNSLSGMDAQGIKAQGIASLKTEQIKCTQRLTSDGRCVVVQDDVPLNMMYTEGTGFGNNHRTLMQKYPGQQYVVIYNDGARMRYVPHNSDPNLYSFHGEIELTIPGKASADSINGAMKRLGVLGVDTTPATALNSEIMYLDKAAYIRKFHIDDDWQRMLARSQGLPLEEQIKARAELLSQKMGVPDVRKLPDYKPDGEYQIGRLSGAKDAGQRLQYRFDLPQKMLNKRMKDYYLIHKITDGDGIDAMKAILQGNGEMSSNVDKIRHGIPVGGLSPVKDTETGGANYFFTRIADMRHTDWQGQVKMGDRIIFKKDMLRRMDAVSYKHDAYGYSKGTYITEKRKSDIDGFKKCAESRSAYSGNETDFKQSVTLSHDTIECYIARDISEVEPIVKMLKKFFGGDILPDGRSVRDIVMTGEEWLKKKGYL